MDYDALMNKINAIDKNAFLVTIESGEYIDVTNCKDNNAEKIEELLRNMFEDGEEAIETVYNDYYFYCDICNKNKGADNGYNSYMRVVNETCVCTDCLADAEENNADLAELYFANLINNPYTANEFLSDEYLEEHGFYRSGRRVHAVGFCSDNDNVRPEKVLEAEQKDGNDVIFDIISSNPFECEYRWYIRKPNWDVKKWSVEVNLHAYGSDDWQVATDEPLEAKSEQEVDDMLSPEFLAEHMSVINEYGESVFVESAEYRIVEVEQG